MWRGRTGPAQAYELGAGVLDGGARLALGLGEVVAEVADGEQDVLGLVGGLVVGEVERPLGQERREMRDELADALWLNTATETAVVPATVRPGDSYSFDTVLGDDVHLCLTRPGLTRPATATTPTAPTRGPR